MAQITREMFTFANLRQHKSFPEVLVVTSGKGGVGKTNVSVNLAILLKQIGKRILLIDADVHLGNADLLLGIRPNYTITDVLTGKIDFSQAIIPGPGGIDFLPAGSAVLELMDLETEIIKKLGDAFTMFEKKYDIIMVDTGAGISQNVMSFCIGADTVILVITPDPASIADAYGIVKVIKQLQTTVPILMIANMVSSADEAELLFKKMYLMVQRFLNSNISYGGAILQDNQVVESVRRQRPLVLEYPSSSSVNAMRIITQKIIRFPTENNSEQKSFFDRFLSNRQVAIGEKP